MVDDQRHYVYGKTRQEVQKRLSAIALKAELGMLLSESDILFGDWLEQWIDSYVNVRDTTLVRYQEDITQHILPALGKIRLCDLRTGHIQQFYNKELKGGMSPKSLHNLHGVVHEALERAVLTDLILKPFLPSLDTRLWHLPWIGTGTPPIPCGRMLQTACLPILRILQARNRGVTVSSRKIQLRHNYGIRA